MIIGNGLLAKAFYEKYRNNDKVIIFASGVSNSNETSKAAFKREQDLLENCLTFSKEKKVIYFSTYSINNPEVNNKKYVLHKMKMENILREHQDYLIFRLSNVVGKTKNPNTLINFLVNRILNDEEVIVWKHAVRNIVDVEDIYKICHHIIDENIKNKTLTLTNPYDVTVQELVFDIADFFQKRPNIKMIDKGVVFDTAPSREVVETMTKLEIDFNQGYFRHLLQKYSYSNKAET